VILGSAEAEHKTPLPLYRTRIQLGDETFELTIADELAKADVNLLLDHTDRATAENRLRQALAGTGLSSQIRLRPSGAALPSPASPASTKPASQPALPQLISGFGQIFTDASAERLLGVQGGVRPADVLTCWSKGQVNLRRVSPVALKIAGSQFTMIEQGRLLEARDNVFSARPKPLPNPEKGPVESDPIRRILAAARVNPGSVRGAPTFTGNSACYSLWITASDKRRTWHYFSLLDQSVKEQPRTAAFVW
jgi:hypothetical protein